jgi:integrase
MGLGALSDVSLLDARTAREKWRSVARESVDPIKERQRLRREAAKDKHLLREIALDAFESRKAELKGDGIAGRWFSPLEIHVLPKLGDTPIEEIDQNDIRDLLAPLWHSKAVTAKKALNRIGICFRHAAARGIDVDLQATEKAKELLGRQLHQTENIPAMPWPDVPAFYATLDDHSMGALALRLTILTGARSTPIRFCRPDEQIEGDIWTIPGEKMKGRRDKTPPFRVPLSLEAQKVVQLARVHQRDGYLFPGRTKGKVMSDATMSRLMERATLVARPHGFRSSLRDWIAEATDTPHDVAETVIAHVVGNASERSYRRTDFVEQRRPLMARWADHVTGKSGKLMNFVRQTS